MKLLTKTTIATILGLIMAVSAQAAPKEPYTQAGFSTRQAERAASPDSLGFNCTN